MTKIILNLQEGLLEVEGEESFVKSVYEDFKTLSTSQFEPKNSGGASSKQREVAPDSSGSEPKRSSIGKKRVIKKTTPIFVKDLDLSNKKNSEDLKTFVSSKSPSSNLERNAVFVYYLKKIAKEDNVTVDHLYTCYKYINVKVPGALGQSLLDTAFKKGWIDTSNMNSITIPVAGENFVEHDLPKVEKK